MQFNLPLEEAVILCGIAYGCPHLERKENCPMKEVDHLSFKEKLNWFDGLSHEKKETILVFHMACTRKK